MYKKPDNLVFHGWEAELQSICSYQTLTVQGGDQVC